MAGWSVQMNFDKTGGRHWLWGANTKIDSENFEVNDFAQLNGADGMADERQHPLSRNAARQGVPQLLRPARCQHRHDAAPGLMQTGRVRGTVNVTWLNYWTSSDPVLARPRHDQRVADPRRSADGARSGLDHERQRRQSRQLAHARHRHPRSSRPTTTARRRKRVTGTFSMRPGRAGSSRCRRSTIA